MTPTPTLASGAVARTAAGEAGTAAAGAAEPGPYVLNLCSSTTPMALEQAQIPELKRFSFFVSRRREDGRERFRLHMGYFATLEEAEEWLNAVRDIYPGAWAGETPGKKLRERAAAEEAARTAPQSAAPRAPMPAMTQGSPGRAAASAPSATGHRNAAGAAAQVALSQGAAPINVPTLRAAAPQVSVTRAAPAQRAQPIQFAPSAPPAARAPSAPAARPPVSAPNRSAPLLAAAAVRAGAAISRSGAPVKPQAQRPAAPVAPKAAVAPRSAAPTGSVSQTSKAVPSTATSRPAPQLAQPAARTVTQPTPRNAAAAPARAATKPAARPIAGSKAAAKALPSSNVREVLAALDEPTGETRLMPAPALALQTDDATLSDTQVLRFLETRRDDDEGKIDEDGASGSISLLKPDDTGTRRALKEAVVHNAPVSFAVQLQWSVQPVELDKVPPLAIFSAYTLYTVEGSRDGRKWYGLRLGFFTDAISAKQVAYYVRSEFASVAVVPVSPQERNRASEDEQTAASGLAFPKKMRREPVDEFKLIDSDEPSAVAPPVRQPAAQSAKQAARPSAPQPPASSKRGGKVRAREHRSPQTLEETLEILGASQLEIDDGRGETLNESGVRHLRVEVQKNTPFRRLIERLSERVRKT